MSEFSRWLTRKYPEYLLEQDAPMQQNAPAQSAAEILRQRQQKRAAGGQGGAPMQQNQDAQAAAERLKQRMQQRQNAGNAGAGGGGSVKDFMNDKNLDSNKASTILNTPNLTLTDQEADHLLKAADLYSASWFDVRMDMPKSFNKNALKVLINKKIEKSGGFKNMVNSEEKGFRPRNQDPNGYSMLNDFEIFLSLNNELELDLINPKQALEIVKEYKGKSFFDRDEAYKYTNKGKVDSAFIKMLERTVIQDKSLTAETLKNISFGEIKRTFGMSKFVEICNEKIKLQGGINNLKTYEINPLIWYNVTNKLTGDRAEFISPQDARKILMRSDCVKELATSHGGSTERFTGGIEWLENRARE